MTVSGKCEFLLRLVFLAVLATSAGGCGLDGRPMKRARMATAIPSPTSAPLEVPLTTPADSTVLPPVPAESKSVLDCPDPAGVVRPETAPSTILTADIEYQIYLPPCYDSDSAATYPVLYLFHGLGRSPDQWIALGLAETADRLIIAGESPPMLIVLPLTPGEDSSDAAFLADLLPAVDAAYRTRSERSYRSIGGISRGAEWALRLAVRRADLFGLVGLHSAAFSPTALPQVQVWMASVPETLRPMILADVGSTDPMRIQTEELSALLAQSGWPRDFQIWPGDHSDEYWKANIGKYLIRYGTAWK
jgi:enterochelin esterase-like enzyme